MPWGFVQISRPVELIFGARNIAKFLGINASSVRRMFDAGAPIKRRGKLGIMICDKAEVWEWYKSNHDF